MKRKILSLTAMVLTTITGNAQNHTFKSLTVEAYEQAIADTTVIRLDVRTSEDVCRRSYRPRHQHRCSQPRL